MRIAVVSWNGRRIGGLETYLSAMITALTHTGHEVSFLYELDEPEYRDNVVSEDVTSWSVSKLGAPRALAALRDWRPDLIYTHKIESPALEAEVIQIAPAVFFAHDYHGTCISGLKTFKFPTARPCNRQFGWQCLLHYFPHGCGGRSPVTMIKLYKLQSRRLDLLKQYDAIVTLSDHMRSEYLKHGLLAENTYRFSRSVPPLEAKAETNERCDSSPTRDPTDDEASEVGFEINSLPYWRLLFLGRMDLLKGGHLLLDALPGVALSLNRPIQVIFAGDGPERKNWKRKAEEIQASDPRIHVEFPGWLPPIDTEGLLDTCDLLVVPSLWPEPFGLVGPEAGQHGVPVAAFAVGGIPDWLKDGVNGHLAPSDPPTAAGLANVIIECLKDPAHHAKLRSGAMMMSERFSLKNHLTALEKVFQEVLSRHAAAEPQVV